MTATVPRNAAPAPAPARVRRRAAPMSTRSARSLARRRVWWVEVGVVMAFYLAYDATRALAPAARVEAVTNAHHLMSFERAIHLDPERALNHALAPVSWLSTLAGYYYLSLHFAVTVIALIFVYRRRPELYARARTSIVIASYTALLGFWFLPVAPPRMAERGVIDIVVQHNIYGAARAQQGHSSFENVYAAMPSLHVGWAVWAALLIQRAWPGRWRYAGWLYPIATALVVLSTGNHYLLDAVAGAALVLAADVLSGRITRSPGHWAPQAAGRLPDVGRAVTRTSSRTRDRGAIRLVAAPLRWPVMIAPSTPVRTSTNDQWPYATSHHTRAATPPTAHHAARIRRVACTKADRSDRPHDDRRTNMSLTEAPDPQPAIPSASIATYLASREATGRWVLDPANSTVEFHTRSMWGLAKVHGRFTTVTGAGTVEADGAVTGELTIDAGSLDTKIKKRDEHLRSAAFFDVEQNPTLTYQVLAITAAGTERVEVTGLLTVRNHREPVTFVATVSEAGPTTVSLNAELTVDRSRFGMSWSPMRMAPMNTRIVVQARFRRGH